MMLSVLVWLAMWGQGQLDDPGIVRPLPQLTKCIDNGDDTTTCPNSLLRVIIDHVELPKPKPAEHVIEIKTRHVKSDQTYHPPKGFEMKRMCDPGYEAMVPVANHLVKDHAVTRELWIDGTKFGVIKGLE
jgi:hypothetical protein